MGTLIHALSRLLRWCPSTKVCHSNPYPRPRTPPALAPVYHGASHTQQPRPPALVPVYQGTMSKNSGSDALGCDPAHSSSLLDVAAAATAAAGVGRRDAWRSSPDACPCRP